MLMWMYALKGFTKHFCIPFACDGKTFIKKVLFNCQDVNK